MIHSLDSQNPRRTSQRVTVFNDIAYRNTSPATRHTQRITITPAENEHQPPHRETNAPHTPDHKPGPSNANHAQTHQQPRPRRQDHRPRRPTHAAHWRQSPTHRSRSTPAEARRAYARPPPRRKAHAPPPTRHKATRKPHRSGSRTIEDSPPKLYAHLSSIAHRVSHPKTETRQPPPLRGTPAQTQ